MISVSRLYSLLAILLLIASCQTSSSYEPSTYITKEKEKAIITAIIRYAAKLPPGASHATKFESQFDEYYKAVTPDYDIRQYFIDKDSTHFILFTRAARSITPMREAIGCSMRFNANGSIAEYVEIFRTWKMSDDVLRDRYPILFEKMVKGESLEPYYSKNSEDEYIEFPDDRFYFDKEERAWKDKVFESDSIH